jgi:hypothetical protein
MGCQSEAAYVGVKKQELEEKGAIIRQQISIEQYLQKVERFADSDYGRMIRTQFEDNEGSSELAMLAAPTGVELEELKRALAIMTADEKQKADVLSDEQVQKIAADARVDPANLAIFFNGYALHCKRVS